MVRVISAVALAASALALLPGCAGGDAAPVSAPGPSEQLLTRRDATKYPESSPARSLLDWWRAAQFADVAAVKAGMARAVRADLDAAGNDLEVLNWFAGAIRSARPTILSVEDDGRYAIVYARILIRQPVGMKRYVVSSVPRAFRFVRERERWVLADDSYLQSILPEVLRRRSPA